jgi:hypothetical protein
MTPTRHVLLATLALAACKSSKPPQPKTEVPRDEPVATTTARRTTPDDGGLFVMAKPQIATMPVPARFTAPLPTTLAQLAHRDALPPQTMLRSGLARGDASVQSRLLAALNGAAKSGPVPDDLRNYYVSLFGYSTPAQACAWLRAEAPKASPPVSAVLLEPLSKCNDEASGKVLLDLGAPAAMIVEWGFQSRAQTIHSDPRLLAAAIEVGKNAETDDARQVGFMLSGLGDAAAVTAALKTVQAGIPDPERRAWVAIGLLHHSSPAVQALGRQACKQPVVAHDPMCRPDSSDNDEGGDPTKRPLDAQIVYGYDADELVTRFSKEIVVAGFVRCAADAKREHYVRSSCLRNVAMLDRAAAANLAPTFMAVDDNDLRHLAAEIAAYPDVAAIDKRLDALGITRIAPPDPADARPVVEVTDVLERRGRISSFDVETGQWPNEHDELLGDLAQLVAPALDGAIFEEVAQRSYEDAGPYSLRAYIGGKRYVVPAENNGDWYDVGAVLGLLNAVLADRGSDQRYMVLETGDQTAIVLAGPAAGLRALVDEGLVQPANADAGMSAGKAFEDKVFNSLQAEGKDVQRDVPISQ